jgi:ankyrin repeat protein
VVNCYITLHFSPHTPLSIRLINRSNNNMTAAFGLGRPPLSSAPADNQPVDNSTPWIAASDGNLNLLQHALTTLNLPPSASDENGYTLLQAAASYSRAAVMQWLIQTQAVNVNAVDTEGDSALHYADKVEAATFLVQSGVDTSLLNAAGKTALQSKQEEIDEMMQDEDTEDDDVDLLNLHALVEYLTSLNGMTMAQ